MPLPTHPHLSPHAARSVVAASTAALGALTIALRYWCSKQGRAHSALVGDPATAARRVTGIAEDEYDFDEYDVVIIGGGEPSFT